MNSLQDFISLLVRPKRQGEESHWGYVLRLAAENGLERPQWLLRPGSRWPTRSLRLCVGCLSSPDSVWREQWLRADQAWCDLHRTWLIDHCPSCQRRLLWSTVRFERCVCGFHWLASEASRVDESILNATSSRTVPLEVMRVLGAFSLYGPRGKIGKKASRHGIAEVHAQISAGFALASHWPRAFYDVLEARRVAADTVGTMQLLKEAFPGLLDLPGQITDAAWRERVATAIDGYCAMSLVGDSPIIARSPLVTSRLMTLKQISGSLGKRVESIAGAIDSGLAEVGSVRITARGRRRRLVREADLSRLVAACDDSAPIKTIARHLAIPAKRVHALAEAGHVSFKGRGLLRSEVAALESSVVSMLPATSDMDLAMLPFGQALRAWVPVEDTGALWQSLRAGHLTLHRPHPSVPLGHCLVSTSAIQAWSHELRGVLAAELSMTQVASELNLKHEVVRDLVRAGLLKARQGISAHRSCWLITASDCAAFKQRYAPLARLAAEAGVRLRDGFAWAEGKGLTLACGPKVDGSRQYFVDLSQRRDLQADVTVLSLA